MSSTRPAALLLVVGLALVGASCGGADASRGTQAVAAKSDAGPTTSAGATARTQGDDAMQGGDGDGHDRGPDGDGGPGGPGGRGGPFGDVTAAARALGITADELRTATAGQTIAQVAASKGVPVETVVAAMVATMKTHFDDEVASGEHTQAEVDALMTDATAMITAVVNGQQPPRPDGDGRPGGDDDHGGGDAGSAGGTPRKARAATTTIAA